MTVPNEHAGTNLVVDPVVDSIVNPDEYCIAGVPDRDIDFANWWHGPERSPAFHIGRDGYNVQTILPAMIRPGAAVLPFPSTGAISAQQAILNDASFANRTYIAFFMSKRKAGPGFIVGNTRVAGGGFAFIEFWDGAARRHNLRVLHGGDLSPLLDVEYTIMKPIAVGMIATGTQLDFVMNGQFVETYTASSAYVANPGRIFIGNTAVMTTPWRGNFYRFMFWKRALEIEQVKELTLTLHKSALRNAM